MNMRRGRKSLNKSDLSSKRRRKNRGKSIFYLVVLVLVVGGIISLMRIDFWKIKEVKVGETKRVDGVAISEIANQQMAGVYWGIFPKNNFLIYPKESIEKEILKTEPAALSVVVNAELDHTLTIEVKERLAVALWCRNATCYFMDEEGVIFAPGLDNSGLLKYYGVVEGNPLGKKFGDENKEFFRELRGFVANMKGLGLEAVAVRIANKDSAQMDFGDGSYLVFLSYEKDKPALFEDIELFINDLRAKNGGTIPAFEYIDARYGNKIFFKTK